MLAIRKLGKQILLLSTLFVLIILYKFTFFLYNYIDNFYGQVKTAFLTEDMSKIKYAIEYTKVTGRTDYGTPLSLSDLSSDIMAVTDLISGCGNSKNVPLYKVNIFPDNPSENKSLYPDRVYDSYLHYGKGKSKDDYYFFNLKTGDIFYAAGIKPSSKNDYTIYTIYALRVK